MSGMLPQLFLHLHYLSCTFCVQSPASFSLNTSPSPGLSLSGGTESLSNGIVRQLNQAVEECKLHHRAALWPPCTAPQVKNLHISDLSGCSPAPYRAEKDYITLLGVNPLPGFLSLFHLFCFPVIFTTLSFRIRMQKINFMVKMKALENSFS